MACRTATPTAPERGFPWPQVSTVWPLRSSRSLCAADPGLLKVVKRHWSSENVCDDLLTALSATKLDSLSFAPRTLSGASTVDANGNLYCPRQRGGRSS